MQELKKISIVPYKLKKNRLIQIKICFVKTLVITFSDGSYMEHFNSILSLAFSYGREYKNKRRMLP